MKRLSSGKTKPKIIQSIVLGGVCSFSFPALAATLSDVNNILKFSSFNSVSLQVGNNGNKLIGVVSNTEEKYELQGSNILISPNIGIFQGLRVTAQDTDGDGYPDEEDAFPYDSSEWEDSDLDGIGNNADQDDDNDSLPDRWEIENSLNPLDNSDADIDTDGDTFSNIEEFTASSDPNDINSVPASEQQQVYVGSCTTATPREEFVCHVFYNTSDSNSALNGLGLYLHLDGEKLEFVGLESVLQNGLIYQSNGFDVDVSDLDYDLRTSHLVSTSWATLSSQWPGGSLPSHLYTIRLKTNEQVEVGESFTFKFTVTDTSSGYFLDSTSHTVTIAEAILDSDGDLIPDDVDNCLNIANKDQLDTDGDAQGDACDADDDNDLLPDLWELNHGLDPLDSSDASIDSDFDGVSNLEEYTRATNPNDPYFNWDIDGDGFVTPLSDGLLNIRYQFGFRGNVLVQNVIMSNAKRIDAIEIERYLGGAPLSDLDIDGDGNIQALSDGLLLLRYLFGFSGDALIQDAVNVGGVRQSSNEIEVFIGSKMPSE